MLRAGCPQATAACMPYFRLPIGNRADEPQVPTHLNELGGLHIGAEGRSSFGRHWQRLLSERGSFLTYGRQAWWRRAP
ncbi:hypothetical protein GCM10010425_79360 [Streptomyces spororaveus]|uniref:Uncharacterized protein n=1 Tax=Streptomyces spororaveus TaxID=284039 RepID=A0ABQ3TR74_9ACTN|nr:hypothetical protein Sspor_02740 [Streptomyces spororaveus]GHI82547.1 hypothetical protein Sspor_81080 [Streptomyces spororaveus]GHI82588.1 hypothetical protein Sspor_81490 [Streptomyces spororaveus]